MRLCGTLGPSSLISLRLRVYPYTDLQGSYTREKAVSFWTGFTRLTRFRESFGLVREMFL